MGHPTVQSATGGIFIFGPHQPLPALFARCWQVKLAGARRPRLVLHFIQVGRGASLHGPQFGPTGLKAVSKWLYDHGAKANADLRASCSLVNR